MHAWRNAASTKSTTIGTEICAATVRCRTRVLASASSAPLLTSRASPTCATRFRSRDRLEMPDIDAQDEIARVLSQAESRNKQLSSRRLRTHSTSPEQRNWQCLLSMAYRPSNHSFSDNLPSKRAH